MAIRLPSLPLPRTTSGSQWSTVSSRDSLPSASSWRTTVATSVLDVLAMRK